MIALAPDGHAVYQLAPGLLLVFKPRGHREAAHTHAHAQQLRVLRGRLQVELAGESVILQPASACFALAPGRPHATEALDDTWLVAETASA